MPGTTVAVIGTGVIGAMAAWQLAVRGARVIALDTYAAGHDRGASAGETRIFRTVYKEGGAYVPLLRRARELWRELETGSGRAILTDTGCLTIGRPDEPDVRAVLGCAAEHELPHETLVAQDIRRRFPQHRVDDDEIAVLDPQAGVLRPEVGVQAALAAAAEAGAEILPYHRVRDLTRRGAGWRVSTDGRDLDVDWIVLAPGPWARETPLLSELPVRVELLTACWFAARAPGSLAPQSFPVGIRRHAEAGFSFFPCVDGVSVKVIPHHLPRPVIDTPDALPRTRDADFVRAASAAVERLLPGLVPHPIRIGTYADGYTPDHDALVGPVPGQDNAIVLTGFSGHGYKLAPVFGRIAADLVLDKETTFDVDYLDPARHEAAA
ncbi:MAG TPA: N-methyl-L-tryptophan oxidase [Actinocatenispora sp.]